MTTVTQTMRYRQALIKYAEKYGVTKAATMYIYDNLNLNDISKVVVECLGETKGQKFYLVFERGFILYIINNSFHNVCEC